mmetsp:Transcript_26834/g.66829  ORF Transcript_26834/g.66829 Transcript_26834/m.66829 type:complete len:211 (+) Transcript_26834:678-1310(+)
MTVSTMCTTPSFPSMSPSISRPLCLPTRTTSPSASLPALIISSWLASNVGYSFSSERSLFSEAAAALAASRDETPSCPPADGDSDSNGDDASLAAVSLVPERVASLGGAARSSQKSRCGITWYSSTSLSAPLASNLVSVRVPIFSKASLLGAKNVKSSPLSISSPTPVASSSVTSVDRLLSPLMIARTSCSLSERPGKGDSMGGGVVTAP